MACPYDPASPAFYVESYRDRGLALRADYSRREEEAAEDYWRRVRIEINAKLTKKEEAI